MSEQQPYRVRLRTFSIIKAAEPPAILSTPISTASAAAEYLLPFFRKEDPGVEHFGCAFLDARHQPIAAKILFSGSFAETVVYPAQIVRAALMLGASAVIAAHNHPSRNLSPSNEDRVLTKRISSALATVDLRLLDHLILSVEDGCFQAITT